jgi:hypothetical protein
MISGGGGPGSASQPYGSDSFANSFDFSKRQNFSSNGYNLDNGDSSAISSFAEFPAFDNNPNNAFPSPEIASFANFDSPGADPEKESTFDGFANFDIAAEFEPSTSVAELPSKDTESDLDFGPSPF